MAELYDKPNDLALLRMFAKAGKQWRAAADIRKAIAWLTGEDGHVTPDIWRRLAHMEEHGGLESRRSIIGTGRDWRLKPGVSVRLYTGGVDVLLMDREDALGISLEDRTVAYRPDAFTKAKTGKEQAATALRQCPSPWDLGARMQQIKWNNPELV